MTHDRDWKIDKVNPVHDLLVCLSGAGEYKVGDDAQTVNITPGKAMLIPAYTRFRGAHGGGGEMFTGIAQHFSLELFGRGDLIRQMNLRRSIELPDWDVIGPLVARYRETTPHGSTTLAQHHMFMVVLLAYIERAFVDWITDEHAEHSQDHLSVQIMLVASRLSADPLGAGVEEAMEGVPYNPDYFRRAFKERLGYTPQKFRELKRMEFAADRLGMGMSVKSVAAELGYADQFYFSRMFKRFLGDAPSVYREIAPR